MALLGVNLPNCFLLIHWSETAYIARPNDPGIVQENSRASHI